MEEELRIEDCLIKLSDEEAQSLKDSNSTLRMNYYVSDSGDVYKAPAYGTTPFWSSPESDDYKFRYNWRTKEIEVFMKNNKSNTYHFVESSPLTLYDFLNEESPEYWFTVYLKDLLKG